VTWSLAGSGSWDIAANWTDDMGAHRVPGTGDDVVIPSTGDPTVTMTTSAEVHSLASQGNLVIAGGSLTLDAASTLDGALTISSGALTATGGLTQTGPLQWSAGSIYGTITNTGDFSISGDSNRYLYGTISTNGGSGTWTGAGTTYFENDGMSSPTLTLGAGAVLDIAAGIDVATYGGTTAATIHNAGKLLVHSGKDGVTINAALNLSGTVDVETGTIAFDGGGTVSAGAQFTGPGTTAFGGGTMTVIGAATAENLAIAGGTLKVASVLTVDGALQWTGGTLAGAGTLKLGPNVKMAINGLDTGDSLTVDSSAAGAGVTWTGGSVYGTWVNQGNFSIGGDANKYLYGTIITGGGSGTWTGTGTTYFENDGESSPTLTIGPDSVIDIQASVLVATYGGSTPATINDDGTILVHSGSDSATINAALNISGTVDVEHGGIAIDGGGTISSGATFSGPGRATFGGGTMTVKGAATGANLGLSGGTLNVDSTLTSTGTFLWTGGTLGGSGALKLGPNAAMTVNGTSIDTGASLAVDSTASGAMVTWTGGSVYGTFTNTGNFSIGGDANKYLYGTIITHGGSGTWTGTGNTYFENDGTSSPNLTFGPAGVIDIQAGIYAPTYGGSTPAVINDNGKIVVHSGSDTATINAALNVAGEVDVETGGIAFDGGGTISSGATFSGPGRTTFGGGTMTVKGAATGANLGLSGGTLNVNSTLTNTGTFLWTGGTLGGSGTLKLGPNAAMTVNGTSIDTGASLAVDSTASGAMVTWTGGSVYGTFTNTGNFSIGGDANKYLYGTIITHGGSGTWTGTGNTYFENDGTSSPNLTFGPAGVIDIQAGIYAPTYGGSTPAVINDNGKIVVHSGSDTATINAALNVAGEVDVETGGIAFDGGGTISSGATFSGPGRTTFGGGTVTETGAATGANLGLSGGTLNVNGTLTNTGTFLWTGGTLGGSGTLKLGPNAAMTIDGTNIDTGASLAVDSTASGAMVTWTGGSVYGTFTNNGNFSIAGADNKYLYGTIATDNGSGTWTGTGTTFFENDGTYSPRMVFGAHASIDIQAGVYVATYGGTTSATIEFGGTLIVHSGTELATIDPTLMITGTVDTETGGVTFNGGGTVGSGATFAGTGITTFAGGTVTVTGPVTALNVGLSGGTLNVASVLTDTGTFLWTGGTLAGTGTLRLGPTATMTINGTNNATGGKLAIDGTAAGASATWVGGSIYGTVNYTGSFNIAGNANKYLYGTVNADGGSDAWSGAGTTYFENDGTSSPVLNYGSATILDIQSAVDTSTYGGSTPATINDSGALLVHAGSDTATIMPTFNGSGTLDVESGSIVFSGGGALRFDGASHFISRASTAVGVSGNVIGGTTDASSFLPQGALILNGTGSAAAPQTLEVMSHDAGAVAAGFVKNFGYGSIALGPSAYVKLVDNAHNTSGNSAEALYVDSLVVPDGATLDLNHLHVYVRTKAIAGSVINGTVTQIATGGMLTLGNPRFGDLLSTSQVDTWTFFARAGDSVAVVVNTGKDGTPAPVSPQVNFAQFEVLGADGTQLGAASNTSSGADAALTTLTIPADGIYTIHVHAQAGANAHTGQYAVGVYDASVNVNTVALNQPTYGQIGSPYSQDQWTFSAVANQQVRFDLLSALNTSLKFSLTGPNGYKGFTSQPGSSDLLTLPSPGTYTLTVQSATPAAYAFRLDLTAQVDLSIGTPFHGTLAGSGQAQLFRVIVPTDESLLVSLADTTGGDHNELYVSKDVPPTRSDYQYRFADTGAANQTVLVPTAAAGTWYVLLYATSVPAPSNYTIAASTSSLHVTGISPATLGNGAAGVVSLSGSGFDAGTTVQFVGKDGAVQTPKDVKSVADAALTLDLDLTKWKAEVYDVKVTDGTTTITLPAAFTVTPANTAQLETNLIVPTSLGRHGSGTLYLTYTNSGAVAMPAPILQVHGTLGALLTLDPSLAGPGLSTATLPAGFSDTVTIIGSGSAATPGLLQPGDSVEVPIFYRGLLEPWDTSKTQVQFTVKALSSTATTPIDWSSVRAASPLNELSSAGQDQFWAALMALAGSMGGTFDLALAANAVANGPSGFRDVIDSLVASAAYQVTADATGSNPGSPSSGSTKFPTLPIGPNSTGIVIAQGIPGADGSPPRTDFIIKGYADGPKQNADGSYNNDDPAIVDALTVAGALPNDRVILVDWTAAANPDGNGSANDASNPVNYQHAARNALAVGDELALWAQENDVAPERVDVFAAGLGAQAAGEFGARTAQIDPGHLLEAIYAADPAGPGFAGRDSSTRLNRADALTVVAIHSTQTLGDTEDVGTTDQFVTGASFNPAVASDQAWTLLLQSLSDPSLRTTDGHRVGYAADTPGEQTYALPAGTQRPAPRVQASAAIASAVEAQLARVGTITTTTTTALADSTDIVSITGPAGFGPQNFIVPDTSLPYQINFENPPAAGVPVQSVTINEQLDSHLDWTTFQLLGVGFGNTSLPIPPDSQFYDTTIATTSNGATFNVQIQVSLDPSSGVLTATFQSIDPDTDLPPDLLHGFLPPEDGSGRGIGYLSYVVSPQDNLPTGTKIQAVATISFDASPAIATNQVDDSDPTKGSDPAKAALTTIDSGAPSSTVAALPAKTASTNFIVSWSGHDDTGGSGIAYYDVYFSDNGGDAKLFEGHTTATSATFTGQRGHTYAFFSVATDNAGNTEAAPAAGQAQTTVLVSTTTVVTATPNPVFAGNSVTLTATVNPVGSGFTAPTGSVTFKEGSKVLGTGTLSTSGGVTKASITLSRPATGKHAITAVYSGDATDAPSTAAAVNLNVDQFRSTTTLVASVNPSFFGQKVTFTATVTGVGASAPRPSGPVTFLDGKVVLGTATLARINARMVATFSTANLSLGKHTITAVYGGDASDFPSTSTALAFVVGKDRTTTGLSASTTQPVAGQTVTFTATVLVVSPGINTPTGVVTFKDGTKVLGTQAVSTAHGVTTARFTASTLSVGKHTITAVYTGDANDVASTSTSLATTVGQDSTSTRLAVSNTKPQAGKPVTFTATVIIVSPGVGTPTGTVTFKDGTKVLGTVAVKTVGNVTTASFTTSALSGAKHTITAVYGGDSRSKSSTSSAVTLNVGAKSAVRSAARPAKATGLEHSRWPAGPLGLRLP
jgi:hypothetical protein